MAMFSDWGDYDEADVDREALYNYIKSKYDSAGKTDMWLTAISGLGNVLGAAAGAPARRTSPSMLATEMADKGVKDFFHWLEKSHKGVRERRQEEREEKRLDLDERKTKLWEEKLANEGERLRKPKKDDLLSPEDVEFYLSLPGTTAEDFLPKRSTDALKLTPRQAQQLYREYMNRQGVGEMPRSLHLDFDKDYGETLHETEEEALGDQEGPLRPDEMSYDDARSLPGGPVGILGKFIQEQAMAAFPGEKPAAAPTRKKSGGGSTRDPSKLKMNQPMVPPGASAETPTTEGMSTERERFNDRVKNLESVLSSALRLNGLLQATDEGVGREEGTEYGNIPGAGGLRNAFGGGLEAMGSGSGPVGSLTGTWAKPLGNVIRGGTTDLGREIRREASAITLLASNLYLKGTGNVSDTERRMAQWAAMVDPTHVLADREMRIGVNGLLTVAREEVEGIRAEYPEMWRLLEERGHPLTRLARRLDSSYDPREPLQGGRPYAGPSDGRMMPGHETPPPSLPSRPMSRPPYWTDPTSGKTYRIVNPR